MWLQVKLSKDDLELWDVMEEATVQAIKAMATSARGRLAPIEYWHDDAEVAYQPNKRKWRIKVSPSQSALPWETPSSLGTLGADLHSER